MPKLIVTLLLLLAGFCVNAQTFDSTYKTTHDSIFVKNVGHKISFPYDSSYYVKAVIDTTVKHDSIYKVNYIVVTDIYKPVIFRTSHDSTVSALSPYVVKTKHDTTFWKCPPQRKCRWVTNSTTHDTTKYNIVTATVTATHDTTFLQKFFDTAHLVKDSIGLFIHDSIFLRNVLVSHIAFKDSIIFLDSPYIAKTTHDTIVKVPIPIGFGAKLQGSVDDQLVSLQALNATWVRTSVILQSFTGIEKGLDKYLDAGLKVACNLRWTNVVPSPFCTDTLSYIAKEKLFLDRYAEKIKKNGGVILCENEPMNLGYYGTAPIENYITLLKVFVRIAQPYNINTSDGCLFIEYLDAARTGNIPDRIKDKIATQAKLIAAYKTIPLTYINVHVAIHDDALETDMIKNALTYLRTQTGKLNVITNEYHYETCTAKSGITTKTISEWRKSGVLICIVWSGDQLEGEPSTSGNSPAMALSLDAALTPLGISQRDAIK